MASNLTQATREKLDKTWRSQVSYGSPLLTRMLEAGNVIPGGTRYEQIYQSATLKSLVQEYGPNDPLNGGSKEIIEKPHWHVAFLQCPVEQSVDERIMNLPRGDTQLVNLADRLADEAIKGIKYKLLDRFYGCAVDNEIDADHTYVQGICSALMPTLSTSSADGSNYGGIARTTAVNTEWNAASYATTWTATSLTRENLDNWLDAAMEYDEDSGRYLVLLGTTLYNQFKSILEAQNSYTPKANKAEQGFDSMTWAGVEIAKDRYLDRMVATTVTHNGSKTYSGSSTSAGLVGDSTYNGSSTYAGTGFAFVLNLDTWHLRYYQDETGTGPFEMTDFFEQDKLIGGVEKKLARVKWKGNLTCDAPNRNLMRANVST